CGPLSRRSITINIPKHIMGITTYDKYVSILIYLMISNNFFSVRCFKFLLNRAISFKYITCMYMYFLSFEISITSVPGVIATIFANMVISKSVLASISNLIIPGFIL